MIDWFDLLAVQGTLKSLFQNHSSKASILRGSAFFMVQLSQPYEITEKTRASTIRIFHLNTLLRFVIVFVPRTSLCLIWSTWFNSLPFHFLLHELGRRICSNQGIWLGQLSHFTGIHSDSLVKNPPAMQETWVRFPGGEEPWEKEMVTHSSILAWEIPHTEEPGGLQSMRLQKSWTYKSHLLAVWSWISYLSFLCSSFFICWEWAISSAPEDYGKDKLRYLAHKETARISYSSYCFLAVKLENYGSTIEYFAMRYFLLLLLWSLTLVQLLSCYGISFEFQWTLRFQRVPMRLIFTVKCMLAHK